MEYLWSLFEFTFEFEFEFKLSNGNREVLNNTLEEHGKSNRTG